MYKLAVTAFLSDNSDELMNDKHQSNGLNEDGNGDGLLKITGEMGRHQHLE